MAVTSPDDTISTPGKSSSPPAAANRAPSHASHRSALEPQHRTEPSPLPTAPNGTHCIAPTVHLMVLVATERRYSALLMVPVATERR